MIATDRRTPQQALAAALHGTIVSPNAILVASHLIVAHPSGIVRADGVPIGRWDDTTDALAARFRAVVGEVR